MTGVMMMERTGNGKGDIVKELRCDSKFMDGVEAGMRAYLQGKIQSLDKVKKDLGIK